MAALDGLDQLPGAPKLKTWEENDIAGRFIIEPILSELAIVDLLVADITRLNFNVVFEIGYAIGRKKRVHLTRYRALTSSDDLIREVGVFDTIGHRPYANSGELKDALRQLKAATHCV